MNMAYDELIANVPAAREWFALDDHGEPDQSGYPPPGPPLLRAQRRFLQAHRLGLVQTVPLPEAQKYFVPEWQPHLSAQLDALISEAIGLNAAADRNSYAEDLCRAAGFGWHPRNFSGWTAFGCIVGSVTQGLVLGTVLNEGIKLFALMTEVLAYKTVSPFDDMDKLQGG
jgi:hypothetical protein